MPTVDSNGVKIYYEVEGSGTPLVLAHGMSMSLGDWKEWGYVAALAADHKVVLIDGRGHGRSDKPRESNSYLQHLRAADHIAVLDQLGIDTAHWVEYSMGASTCFGTALNQPERCRSMILGGFQPYESQDLSHLEAEQEPQPFLGLPYSPDPILDLLAHGAQAWTEFWAQNIDLSPEMIERQASNDFTALIAYWNSPDEWKVGIGDRISEITIPCLFFASEYESVVLGAREAARVMPNCDFVMLSKMNHFDIFARTDQVIPLIRRFVADVEVG